jgi:hypothetical protein
MARFCHIDLPGNSGISVKPRDDPLSGRQPNDLLELPGKDPRGLRRDKLAYSLRGRHSDRFGLSAPGPEALEGSAILSSWNIGQKTGNAVRDNFRMASHIGGDHWSSAQHRFDHRQRKTL